MTHYTGTYTCASPRGLTNSITIVVAGMKNYNNAIFRIRKNSWMYVKFEFFMNVPVFPCTLFWREKGFFLARKIAKLSE